LEIYENHEIYTETINFVFYLTFHGNCNKMDTWRRRDHRDGKWSRDERSIRWSRIVRRMATNCAVYGKMLRSSAARLACCAIILSM